MKSTGEVMGVGQTWWEAYYKAIIGSTIDCPGLPVENEVKKVFLSVHWKRQSQSGTSWQTNLPSMALNSWQPQVHKKILTEAGIPVSASTKLPKVAHISSMPSKTEIATGQYHWKANKRMKTHSRFAAQPLQHKVFNVTTLNAAAVTQAV